MAKHGDDKKKNLEALAKLKAGDKVGAAKILKTTSVENQLGVIKRITRK